MANLQHIDLTRHQRFENALLDEKNKTFRERSTQTRVINKLKKGEIPHKSNDEHVKINFTDESSYLNITWDSFFINTTAIAQDDWTFYTATNWPTDINDLIAWTTITTSDSYSTNTSTYNFKKFNSTNYSNPGIGDRMRTDPFSHSDDIFNYMNSCMCKLRSDEPCTVTLDDHIQDDLMTRMKRASHIQNHNTIWESSIEERLDVESDEERTSDFWGSHYSYNNDTESYLKRNAPFIKRVYMTNNNSRFDSRELSFDLVIAKEHFDNAIDNLRMV